MTFGQMIHPFLQEPINWDKYILQCSQIHFEIKTNIVFFSQIWPIPPIPARTNELGQIYFAINTNTFQI